MFYVGYGAGGPAFYWTWPAVFLGQITVGLCFAELAACYPLSGGIYHWSRSISSRAVGWMAGWIYLCGSVISLAAVALALQSTLPQIAPVFQLIGDSAVKSDGARNAVVLGCLLIGLTTLINAVGVRLMARINNIGVIAELAGVTLLIVLLAAKIRRGPAVLFETLGHGDGQALGYHGPIPDRRAHGLVRVLRVRHGRRAGRRDRSTPPPRSLGDPPGTHRRRGGRRTADSLRDPRRQRPRLGRSSAASRAACAFLVKDVLGANLGALLLRRCDLRRLRLRPGSPRRSGPAHVRHGPRQ